jgi:2-keto-3-deoxy-L-rhamnonate aldolase RhmA
MTADEKWSREYWDKGYRLFAMGIDSMLLQGALRLGIDQLHALASSGKSPGNNK